MLRMRDGRLAIEQLRPAIGPMLVLGLAAALWLISDRLVYVGPLDRATFGWLVVVPVWALAPAAAGLAGRDLEDNVGSGPALIDGLVLGAATAGFLWWSTMTIDCAPTRTPLDLAVSAAILGVLVGGAFALACRIAIGQAAGGHPFRAVILGALPQVATLVVAPLLGFYMFFGLCQRP